jgi:hypothetical protein
MKELPAFTDAPEFGFTLESVQGDLVFEPPQDLQPGRTVTRPLEDYQPLV